MDSETQKIIEEQMKKLPKDVIAAIVSVDYKTKLQEITGRQKLLIDQAGKLEMETTLVMIGLEPLADYIGNLERELEVPTERARAIATDVSENIFKPIRESLRAMNQKMEGEEIPSREQVMSEIENPSLIGKSETQTLETLAEKPYQQDIKITKVNTENAGPEEMTPKSSLLETKMAGITFSTQQVVEAKPETKLPTIEKKRPSSGIDPYREEII